MIRMSNSSNPIPAIQLPTGGQLLGFAIPHPPSSECSAITNLQTQVNPLIVSMTCQFKILKLIKPLIDVIQGLPTPPVKALEEFSEAAVALAPCLLITTPSSVLPFVHDLLCVEIRSLRCLLRNLQGVIAGAGANPTLGRSALDSYPPIVETLKLATELFHIAGLTVPEAPILGAGIDDDSLIADQNAILNFTTALQSVAETISPCP